MTLDWTKPIQTRSGLKAELIRRGVTHPVSPNIVLVDREAGRQVAFMYPDGGNYRHDGRQHDLDIVNAPVVSHGYFLLDSKYALVGLRTFNTSGYPGCSGFDQASQVSHLFGNRGAILKVTWHDGKPTAVELIQGVPE